MSALARLLRSLAREARRAQADVTRAVEFLAEIHARRLTGPNAPGRENALVDLAAALSRLQAASDLSGRLSFRSRPKIAYEQFAAEPDPVVLSVAFGEAIRDLEERDPLGAAELRLAGLEVEDAYGGVLDPSTGRVFYRHGFALARASDSEVAARVRDRLVSGMAQGKTTDEVVGDLTSEWDWPRSYAALVTRNAVNTATSAGRFREAQRVASAGIPTGFEFMAVMDSNTRPGHGALNGMRFRFDDPILRSWSPPLGPNCRCTLSPLVGDDVPVAFETLPHGAEKDPGYGTRQDLRAYA